MNRRKFLLSLVGAGAATAVAIAGRFAPTEAPPPLAAGWITVDPCARVDGLFNGELGHYHGVTVHQSPASRTLWIDGEEYYVVIVHPDAFDELKGNCHDAVWRHLPVQGRLDFWT